MNDCIADLDIRRMAPQWAALLADFFACLVAAGDEAFFHPHPLSAEAAEELANYKGADQYYVAVDAGRVIAYGLLRGWDEGFAIPSLGIAVLPEMRHRGVARALMKYLHASARAAGATQVRLKVETDNLGALTLYRQLGYQFVGSEGRELVGYLTLNDPQQHLL